MSAPLIPAADPESPFDVRWASWQKAGAAQDRIWNRRAAVTAVLAFNALVTWLAISLYLA